MTDRLEYLKHLQYPEENIPLQLFSDWKNSSVTRSLFRDLVIYVFDELDQPLPESFEQTIVTVHQREGAMKLMDALAAWEPRSVIAERNKAAERGHVNQEAE